MIWGIIWGKEKKALTIVLRDDYVYFNSLVPSVSHLNYRIKTLFPVTDIVLLFNTLPTVNLKGIWDNKWGFYPIDKELQTQFLEDF